MISAILFALTSALAVVAQTNHTVTVGQGGPVFTPNNIIAAPNDIINFVFVAKNHSVTQSTFAQPCGFKADGLDSGFIAASDATEGNALSFAFRVVDANPLWFYCKFGPHCSAGMVFAVNPTAEQTMEQYLANARASPPPGDAPAGGAPAPDTPAPAGGEGTPTPGAPAGDAGASGAPTPPGGAAPAGGAADPSGGAAPLPGTSDSAEGATPTGAAVRLGSGAATILAVVGVVASLL